MIKDLKFKILLGFYFTVIASLFLYSFTQIDLSLTFSRIEILRNIVKSFQYIGYFNRPLSAAIYTTIIILLFGFYLYFMRLGIKKKLDKKFVWKILFATSAILILSYNAFSYDLFNYIFDAKIYTQYNLNPYLHKALDFPGDPMLSFMRWTHRVYPYGPVWLLITIPLSYGGAGFFLPTFFMFKLLIAASYIGSLYFISKILRKIAPENEILGLIFFGLNPLVIIESLVSPHLDIVMMFFAFALFYQLTNKKYFLSQFFLGLSIGTKFATVLLLPIYLYVFFLQQKNKKINWNMMFALCTILMSLAVILSSFYSGNFQPWYLLLPLSFSVFLVPKYYVLIPGFILTFFALLTYLPYLYIGNWDPPIPQILHNLEIGSVILSITVVAGYYAIRTKN